MLSQTDDDRGFTAESVLSEVAAARRLQLEAAATVLQSAAVWADLHPGLDPDWIAYEPTPEQAEIPLAGDGTPTVDSRCVAELGAVLEQSTDAAQRLIGDALELRHRLPRLWARVMALRVPAWDARFVAQQTKHLSADAAAHVDSQLQLMPRLIGGRVVRLVDAAVARFMPDLAELQRLEAMESRRVDIDQCRVRGPVDGLAAVSGVLDLADALDLDHALNVRAAELGRMGVDGSDQVRRSIALGDLARASQDTLDLQPASTFPEPDTTFPEPFDKLRTGTVEGQTAAPSARKIPGRQVVFYVHLSEAALSGTNEVGWLDLHTAGRLDLVDAPIMAGQIRGWCGQPGAKIIVKPVIDLNQTISVAGYHVPDRIIERLRLRDGSCVFPHCRNRRTDADHLTAYDHDHPEAGGQTSTDELAPLCRRHHRLKTHTRWRYRMIRAGCYLWTSPYGRRYLRDETGMYPIE